VKLKIEIRSEKNRVNDFITLDEYSALRNGDPEAIRNVLARFMIDPKTGDYYPVKITDTEDKYKVEAAPEALEKMGMITIEKMMALSMEFLTGSKDELVPPANGGE
jgi:hypothetical protein